MIKYTNNSNLPVPIVAWLMDDDYDYNPNPQAISATSLIKSPKKSILARSIIEAPNLVYQMDVADRLASRRGQGIHQDIENAMGKPELLTKVKDTFGIELNSVMLEERLEWPVVVNGIEFIITGKFDAIMNKSVTDWKTESVYGFGDPVKYQDRVLQLSIYAWLCHKNGIKVNTFVGQVYSIFQDWSPKAAKNALASDNSKYPPHRVMPVEIQLMSQVDTEEWIIERIKEHRFQTKEDVIDSTCTAEELWMKAPIHQYFGSATAKRASRNFDTAQEAATYKQSKGGVGVIKLKQTFAKACEYCLGSAACPQYMTLTNAGLIENASSIILITNNI